MEKLFPITYGSIAYNSIRRQFAKMLHAKVHLVTFKRSRIIFQPFTQLHLRRPNFSTCFNTCRRRHKFNFEGFVVSFLACDFNEVPEIRK